jgi:hypothetical protein
VPQNKKVIENFKEMERVLMEAGGVKDQGKTAA